MCPSVRKHKSTISAVFRRFSVGTKECLRDRDQWSLMAARLLMLLLLSWAPISSGDDTAATSAAAADAKNVSGCRDANRLPSYTVCVVEERSSVSSTENLQRSSTCFRDVEAMLTYRLYDVMYNVTLIRQLVRPEDFEWTPQSACAVLNESCSGLVVSLSSMARKERFENWAQKQVVPFVIITESACSMTSSPSANTMTSLRGKQVLLQQLLNYLHWSQVAVLVDSRSIDSCTTAQVIQQLSDVYMGTLLFQLFQEPRHQEMGPEDSTESSSSSPGLQHVWDSLHLVKESNFKTMLVLAPVHSAALILQEARKLRLLSREHYWVLDLTSSGCFNLLNEVEVKDANLLIVGPELSEPEPEGPLGQAGKCRTIDPPACGHVNRSCVGSTSTCLPQASKMADAVDTLVRAAEQARSAEIAQGASANSSVCENSTDAYQRRAAVVKQLAEFEQSNGSAPNVGYSICSTESESESGLVEVGRWSRARGLQLSQDTLYMNTFRDFAYKTVRVGTREAKPFVRKIGNTSMFEGFCVDILDELAHALKFNYVFVEPVDGEWGDGRDDGSGNWTGIIQLVRAKEVDFGIGPITITSAREGVIDFTKPFMEDGVGILTKRPNSDSKEMFKMFTPLTPMVWAAVAGAVVLVTGALYFIERLSPFSARNLRQDRTLGLLGSLWLIYGSYMEQGGEPHPRSVSARFLVGSWWLFTILMTSTYTANLAAFLTVTIEESPINSLSELAASSSHRPLVKTGSNLMTLFRDAEGGMYQQIWDKMSDMPVVKDNEEAKVFVRQDSYAYMTDASQLEYIMLRDCDTYSVAQELFNTGGFGFVLQEDSPYMDVINYNIMKMQEAGLMDKWKQRWWSSPDPCSSSGRTSTAKELDWPSLSGLFYIFLGVTITSILCRVLELFYYGDRFQKLWTRLKSVLRLASGSNKDAAVHVPADSAPLHNHSAEPSSEGNVYSSPSSFGYGSQRSRYENSYSNQESFGRNPRSAEPPASWLVFDGPYSLEMEEEWRRSGALDFSDCVRGERRPVFQNVYSKNEYWNPPGQRRECAS